VRRSSTENNSRINHIQDQLTLVSGDLMTRRHSSTCCATQASRGLYNLAAQSFVQASWTQPCTHGEADRPRGHARLLERDPNRGPRDPFLPGHVPRRCSVACAPVPQNEETAFYPRSPYGVAKVLRSLDHRNYARVTTCTRRRDPVQHESPRRGLEFVTRKSQRRARIKKGLSTELRLGNLEAQRDWGYAADYVRAMASMLQRPEPDDFVIATGETHSVRELCEVAFSAAGLRYEQYVVVDPAFIRPPRWTCWSVTLPRPATCWLEVRGRLLRLIEMMVAADLEALEG